MSEPTTHRAVSNNGAIVLAGVVFVVSVAAFCVLTITGHDTNGLMVLVGPAIGALIVSGQLTSQNKSLDKIDRQTNGALTRRDDQITDLTQQLVAARAEAEVVKVATGITAPPG